MRVHNFGAGPCALPLEVLEEVRQELPAFGGTGMSIVEMSHRSREYADVHEEAIALAREMAAAPDEFEALIVQGGATLQFSMVPLNLLGPGEAAGHVVTGAWADKAWADGAAVADAYVVWDGSAHRFTTMPPPGEVEVWAGTRYVHVTTNETINGIRMIELPATEVPLVADMSSEYLARPIEWDRYDVVYGGVQKNLAPAGIALVFVRRSALAERSHLGSYLSYRWHAAGGSLGNTPAMFQVYVMGKVLRHLIERGGTAALQAESAEKSDLVYRAIDRSEGFYQSPVDPVFRSHTNVVFRLADQGLEGLFLGTAREEGMVGLEGHRSVGGVRASLYAATPPAAARDLAGLMGRFAAAHG